MFTNLIETDQVYGHRHDFAGFAGALERDRRRRGRLAALLRDDDLLVLTADHGCDLTSPRTDHTREHAPLLAGSPATARAATTVRWPTSGPACCAGWPAREAAELPGQSFLVGRSV